MEIGEQMSHGAVAFSVEDATTKSCYGLAVVAPGNLLRSGPGQLDLERG